ncbi:hypothetical protein D3C81_1623130 [compost metagenome]
MAARPAGQNIGAHTAQVTCTGIDRVTLLIELPDLHRAAACATSASRLAVPTH